MGRRSKSLEILILTGSPMAVPPLGVADFDGGRRVVRESLGEHLPVQCFLKRCSGWDRRKIHAGNSGGQLLTAAQRAPWFAIRCMSSQ
jgi:hypothetical protein